MPVKATFVWTGIKPAAPSSLGVWDVASVADEATVLALAGLTVRCIRTCQLLEWHRVRLVCLYTKSLIYSDCVVTYRIISTSVSVVVVVLDAVPLQNTARLSPLIPCRWWRTEMLLMEHLIKSLGTGLSFSCCCSTPACITRVVNRVLRVPLFLYSIQFIWCPVAYMLVVELVDTAVTRTLLPWPPISMSELTGNRSLLRPHETGAAGGMSGTRRHDEYWLRVEWRCPVSITRLGRELVQHPLQWNEPNLCSTLKQPAATANTSASLHVFSHDLWSTGGSDVSDLQLVCCAWGASSVRWGPWCPSLGPGLSVLGWVFITPG